MPIVTRTGTSTQQQEAGEGASQDQTQGQVPPPPPPPNMDMAQLLQAFREERQANTVALQMIAQAVNRQPRETAMDVPRWWSSRSMHHPPSSRLLNPWMQTTGSAPLRICWN